MIRRSSAALCSFVRFLLLNSFGVRVTGSTARSSRTSASMPLESTITVRASTSSHVPSAAFQCAASASMRTGGVPGAPGRM